MAYLSRKQEKLIADLESCTAALKERARKIETCKNKSVTSNSKRKREVWKTRNNSGQVAAVLNALRKPSADSDNSSGNTSLFMQAARQAAEAMISSPAKRAKKAVVIPKKTIASRSTPKASGTAGVLPPKMIRDCYCQALNKNPRPRRTACKFGKNCPLVKKPLGPNKDLSLLELDSQRKTLEEARSVISYSPESIFLRRLKTRSQINLNAKDRATERSSPGKCRTRPSVVKDVDSAKDDSQDDSSLSVTDSPKECMHRIPTPLKKKKHVVTSKKSSKLVHSRKENRQSPPLSGSMTSGSKKTGSKVKSPRNVMQQKKSVECTCHLREVPGYDIVGGLADNAKQSKQLDTMGNEKDGLVNKVSEFRRTHWFDCHAAHDHHKDMTNSTTSLLGKKIAPDGHECVHRYFLNDRLFPTPLYTDAENRSRCMKCHLPEDAVTNRPSDAAVKVNRPRGSIEISLPKRIISKPLDEKPSVAGFKVKGKAEISTKATRTSRPCPLLHPCAGKVVPLRPSVPTNSLALRFQKGIV